MFRKPFSLRAHFSAGASFTQGMANAAQGDEQPSQRHIVLDERHATADDKRLCKLTRAVVLLEQSRSPKDLARVASRRTRDAQ